MTEEALSDIEELNSVYADLTEGRTAKPVTIRNFLWWFGAQRRTENNVRYINDQLAMVGIRTIPDYQGVWVETPITFELIADHQEDESELEIVEVVPSPGIPAEEQVLASDAPAVDPSYTIGEISSANNVPVKVAPNATLSEATTLMLSRNFSQLPVMTNERDVKGVISWESIGLRTSMNMSGPDVQSYMESPQEIPASASLFAAINTIVEHNYVLIRAPDRRITGIVTATDIALQFEEISTPFLLIAEIEKNIRIIIDKKLTVADIRGACAVEHLPESFETAADLTFGNYVRIFENTACFTKLCLGLNKETFTADLTEINAVRNDVMHFNPDPLTSQDLKSLRNMASLLNKLRRIGVF
ncbi:CBS domain-containing protein [Methylobacterium sp. J-059]|uniref:CBS domain-containing protein n=1 Tax=Methylobacterium sp. J-059 TaxID=2836643 RepID=UPI001FBA82D5|nr:CBS domain-containing protein [Methylobacterium sp. J-059]MCJ2039514.1 CBS domain-containing protein [Methylobacterium sp. J-059]